MTLQDIAAIRLHNHHLTNPDFKSPEEAVKWLGAVQAQEYLGGLLSIGMRMTKATESEVELSVNEGKIVRTWPMRGTIHFVPAEDLRWMVKHLAARIIKRNEYYHKQMGLDPKTLNKGQDLIVNALQGGKAVAREDLYELLESHGINCKKQRGLFILGHLAHNNIVCFGPKQGKKTTFVLIDEWIPKSLDLTKDQALAKAALSYFRSHGPAQLIDFCWWSGLTQAEAKIGLAQIKSELEEWIIDGKTYYGPPINDFKLVSPKNKIAYLLQAYDEYTVSYKDRSAIFNTKHATKVKNDVNFFSILVINGEVLGFWKRTFKKGKIDIDVKPLRTFSKDESIAVEAAVESYSSFIGNAVGEIRVL